MKERRGMATYRIEGNNVATSYNPTEQEQNAVEQLTQKLEKAREALKQIIVNDQRRYERDLTPTSLARLALKELE